MHMHMQKRLPLTNHLTVYVQFHPFEVVNPAHDDMVGAPHLALPHAAAAAAAAAFAVSSS